MQSNTKGIKKGTKILLWTIGVILILLLIMYGIFKSSTVQSYLTGKISSIASSQLNVKIDVGAVDIDIFDALVLNDIYVADHHKDTLLFVKQVAVDIIDYSVKKNIYRLDHLKLHQAKLYLKQYPNEEDLNILHLINKLTKGSKKSSSEKGHYKVECGELIVDNLKFKLKNFNATEKEYGLDFENLDTRNLCAEFRNVLIHDDTVKTDIDHLHFTDKSGLKLSNLKGNFYLTPQTMALNNAQIELIESKIIAALSLTYDDYDAFSEFNTRVIFNAQFDKSTLSSNDVAFFIPDLREIDQSLNLFGGIKGTVSNLKARNLNVTYGQNTSFSGNMVINGLPNIEETFFMIHNLEVNTDKKDLDNVPVPPFGPNDKLKVPSNLESLNNIQYKGSFTGFLNDFVVYGNLKTAIGSLTADLKFTKDSVKKKAHYKGKLSVNNFDLGRFYNVADLGKTTIDAELDGSGLSVEEANMEVNANVHSIAYKGYNYEDFVIEGNLTKEFFSGSMLLQDENIDFDFDGKIDLSGDLPEYAFKANVAHANLTKLNIIQHEDSTVQSVMSLGVTSNLKGNSLDNIQGVVAIDSLKFDQADKNFVINKIEFNAITDSSIHDMELHSDIVDARISGEYKKEELINSFESILNSILPSYFPNKSKFNDQQFTFSATVKDIDQVTRVVLPKLNLNSNVSMSGNYSSRDSLLKLEVKIPEIIYDKNQFTNLKLGGKLDKDILNFEASTQKLNFMDSLYLDNLELLGKVVNDEVQFEFSWVNEDSLGFFGNFNGFVNIYESDWLSARLNVGEFMIDDMLWELSEDNEINIDSTSVELKNFIFNYNGQEIGIDGKLSEKDYHEMFAIFRDVNLSLLNPALKPFGTQLNGVIDGKASVRNIYVSPVFSSGLEIAGLKVNEDSLGNTLINASYNSDDKEILILGSVGNVVMLNAKYLPEQEKDNISGEVKINDLNIKFIEKFTGGELSDVNGLLTGGLFIRGDLEQPKVTGELELKGGKLKVNYLNTTYTFSEEIIIIEDDWIGFDIIEIRDEFGNKALATGTIIHENFGGLNFDINVAPDKFLCLNTSAKDNSTYYGTAFVTGSINVSGYADQLEMDIIAKTEKGTQFYIPLGGTQEVSEIEYITFVSKDTSKVKKEKLKKDLSGIQMNFDLEVTQDAEAQLIFDEKTGDVIRARGNGDISMEINTSGKFNIYGNYEVVEGDYLFTLENLLNKKFILQPGGTIAWTGDPYSAKINMQALYKLRAPLKDLGIPGIDTTGKRVPVHCYLNLEGDALAPEIYFDLDMPSIRSDQNAIIKNSIKNNDAMNKEVFSLLLLNRFMPLTQYGSGGVAGGNVGGKSSSEVLSNQLSNWLSKISDEFDIGLNYRPGDEVSSREVEVALSTQLFNDRVSVSTNIGVAGENESTAGANSNSNNLAGDFTVEYKVSKDGRIRAKAFNESNDFNDITSNGAKYTQGAGVFYQQDFNTFSELWKKWFGKQSKDKNKKQ